MQNYPANGRYPWVWYDYYWTTYDQENQYDINQFIVNKTTKFTNYTLPLDRNYLAWKGRFQIWRTMQRMSLLICWWTFVPIFVLAFIIVGAAELASGPTGVGLAPWTWTIFTLMIFFMGLGCYLYYYPVHQYCKINQLYLPQLITIFEQMQHDGYIDPNIKDYPKTIQVIYCKDKWYNATKDPNYPFDHYCYWFGFLSLRYFIGQYKLLKFPLTNENKEESN